MKEAIVKEVNSLRLMNRIVYILTILGGLFMVLYGVDPGNGLPANAGLVAFGITSVILPSLIYRLILVIALHVEKSHSK